MLKEPIKGNIEFANVSFTYPNRDHKALDNVSFSVREGGKIGFVGSSGSGKSTIISLLLGFYSPNSGNIFIEGINIKDFDLHHLRSSFGIVSQEPILLNHSIGWNIRYNKTESSDE